MEKYGKNVIFYTKPVPVIYSIQSSRYARILLGQNLAH